jgi:predicted AAA+ superfamily ATPase
MEEEALRKAVRKSYCPRVIDRSIREKLSAFGGVLITGPRSCGKSWTGAYHANSSYHLGDEDSDLFAENNPAAVLEGEYPRLIDEWQDVPKLWDLARRNIDFGNRKGMYIFTGSSVPPLDKTRHTGIGRFSKIRMRTMSLFESGDSSGSVSLSELFGSGKAGEGISSLDYGKTVRLICRGGWPANLALSDSSAYETSREYVDSVSEDTYPVDGRRRSSERMKLVMASLARNCAAASIPTISADIENRGGRVSDQTVRSYIDVLKKLYVIEEQTAWNPQIRSRARLRTTPKRHYTDPSLAAAALSVSPGELSGDIRTVGFLFESLCFRDVSVYASAIGGKVYYYRDDADLEVDMVVQLGDGRWGAAEVKLGRSEFDKASANLIRMKNKMTASGAPEPSFLAVLNATGGFVNTRPDGVLEIPIDCLGP